MNIETGTRLFCIPVDSYDIPSLHFFLDNYRIF